MKLIRTAILTGVMCIVLIGLLAPGTAPQEAGLPGTRVGEVGWQYDSYAENVFTNVTPENPTTMDSITITITSIIPEVAVKQASLYGVIYPNDGVQFPFSWPFHKVDDITFECVLEPFPLNGYDVEFYIIAYDYFYSPIDSTDSLNFRFSVLGSGWRHDTFAENVEINYWPLRANASEEVEITLASTENVTISGANLYVIYETPEGVVEEGGWNFTKTNINSTALRQVIPGYPAGTNITFWVTAWDMYNAVMTSRMYNYSVMGVVEYTDFPFEYTDETGDKSLWIPDDMILIPMAGMCALAIPLFIYLYAIDLKRRKRAVNIIVSKNNEKPAEPDDLEKGDETDE